MPEKSRPQRDLFWKARKENEHETKESDEAEANDEEESDETGENDDETSQEETSDEVEIYS